MDPFTLALLIGGTLASTGGSYLNSRKQARATEAMNAERAAAQRRSLAAQEAERARQRGFEDEQTDLQRSVMLGKARPEKLEEEIDAQSADMAETMIAGMDDMTLETLPGQSPDSIINAANARTINEGAQRTREQLSALARLGAYEGGMADLGRALDRSGQRISTIGGIRQGSAQAGQQEMEQTLPDVQPNDSIGADLLIALGQTATAAAGSGRFGGRSANRMIPAAIAGSTAAAPRYSPVPVPRPRY